ncbi:MAG: hypothetical protein JKY99_01655, partial [Rhizobiales bacterium]|nr:hypothetical protein [Hyphomicrobiales bacterium]
MQKSLSGSHHCVGAMMHSTDSFVRQLVLSCQALGHGLSVEDIQFEAAKYKRSSTIDVESQKVFDTCMTAVSDDHSKVAVNEEYTDFLIYKTFHAPITKAFSQQLNRSKSNWRIEFSKALAASATELFDVDIDQPAKRAYERESRKTGAELRLDDVFSDKSVLVAIEEFKSALR